jgi:hypothetical protein
MANAVIPRVQGDEYQARVFWLESTRLFADDGVVTSVGFEVDNVKAFDDVVVYYDGPDGSRVDPHVRADYFQVKFHVTNAGAFTAVALIDPAFIGAETVSLLERVRDAQQQHAPTGAEARFIIVSPWTIDPNDVLAKLVGNKSGEIRLDVLRKGGPRSAMGKVRKMWKQRLDLGTDDALYVVLRGLRIRCDYPTLDGLRERLNPLLVQAGMKPFEDGKLVHGYDTLPVKLLQEGRTHFTRSEMEGILARESLALPTVSRARPVARQLGIRSYARWAEHMEDETANMLCLLHRFDGRSIRDVDLWNASVLPAVGEFLTASVTGARALEIHLDTHGSIAFAAGWILDPKSGVVASPVQRSVGAGRVSWCVAECAPCRDSEVWTQRNIVIAGRAPDVALVLNVTRAAIEAAEPFIREHVPSVGEIVSLTPCSGHGSGSVRDAAHARRLADEAAALVAAALQSLARHVRVHVFAAAPNGLMFFLGQAAHVWGRCVLYEHDFERRQELPYARSIQLPTPG